MRLTPTSDSRISETTWTPFVNALIEIKYYFAKVDNLLIYVKAQRGISYEQIKADDDNVHQVLLDSAEEVEDNSLDQFNKLVKFLNSPVERK